MSEFNYKDSLNGLKASLFDIYEDQEQKIGIEQNPEKRNARLNKFIEVKDIALMLIEGINYLYDDTQDQTSTLKEKLENPKIPSEVEESKILNMVENSNIEGAKKDDIDSDEQDNFNEDEIEIDDQDIFEKEDLNSKELKRYYLDCDMKDVNFAYVPPSLYEKVKSNQSLDIENKIIEKEIEEKQNSKGQRFMKQDSEKSKGIIVRSDQYMKLALSKHRQEGVLKEAKKYRIEEVKRKRKENQKKELEKAEVKINI